MTDQATKISPPDTGVGRPAANAFSAPDPPGTNGAGVVNGGAEVVPPTADVTDGIAGISALKGLIMYGATLAFAGLYAYFMVRIFAAPGGHQPVFDATLIAAAAALAGVLGSAFALEIGTPTRPSETNPKLARALATEAPRPPVVACLWRVLSLEPSSVESASWPKTFGIWLYALIATAVAVTYVVNQGETPDAIKALAVAFAGYVIALINAAYHGKAA